MATKYISPIGLWLAANRLSVTLLSSALSVLRVLWLAANRLSVTLSC